MGLLSVCGERPEKESWYGFSSLRTQILRVAARSEHQRNFLMPPRAVGETLPPELLEYYEAQKRRKAQQAKPQDRAKAEATGKAEPGQKNSEGLAVSVLTVVPAGSPAHTP